MLKKRRGDGRAESSCGTDVGRRVCQCAHACATLQVFRVMLQSIGTTFCSSTRMRLFSPSEVLGDTCRRKRYVSGYVLA